MASVRDLGNHIAYVEGVGQEARDNFDIQGIVSREVIEEDIITVVEADKGVHEIICRPLHIADEFPQLFPVLEDEVHFVETDDGALGQVDRQAVFLDDGRSDEMEGLDILVIVVVLEADDLRMGMMDRAAGHVAVVAVEDDGPEFSHVFDLLPFSRPNWMSFRAYSGVYDENSPSQSSLSMISVCHESLRTG